MATVSVNFRLDSELKKSFEKFCDANGMTVTTALTLFVSKTVQENKIPFEIGPGRPSSDERSVTVETFSSDPEALERRFYAYLDAMQRMEDEKNSQNRQQRRREQAN